jgi:hypothetical protein
MTRGDQRERARERNRKKQEKLNKGKSHSTVAYSKRKETDAEIMRQKQKVSR